MIRFTLSVILLVASMAQARASDLWPEKIKVGGEFRTRVESQIHYQFVTPNPVTDTYLLFRTRVYLDLNPQPGVRLFGMFQDAETVDQIPTTVNKTLDSHSLYQGWLYLKNSAPTSTSLKLGRQEFTYGEQRLVGNFDWGNLGRSFDGARLRLENDAFWLDFFGARIQIPSGLEQQFAGGYGHWKKFPKGEFEPYVLVLHGGDSGPGGGELSLVTIGSRVQAKFKKNWDYGFEGAYQVGSASGNLASAFATHLGLGFTFSPAWKPRLAVEYNFASGDETPNSGSVTTFNNLYPTNHEKFGLMDLFSWQNVHDLRLVFTANPVSFMRAMLNYHLFFLPEPADGVILSSGIKLRQGIPGASPFAGQEMDMVLRFNYTNYFDSQVGYGIFFPGTFFSDTGGSHVAQFFYTQVSAHY